MVNVILILLIAVLCGVGIYSTVKHFRGQGGCCGSGGYRVKKKKLSSVIERKLFHVEGMHCENCKRRVEEVINDMSGIAGHADLKKGELTVSYATQIDDDVICSRLERAGYHVVGKIERLG